MDPGFGFGKTLAHNLALLAGLEELCSLGLSPAGGLVAQVHDRRIDRPAGGWSAWPAAWRRAVLAVERGARLVRVHDVAATVDALRLAWALHCEEKSRSIVYLREERGEGVTRKYFGTDGIRGRVGEGNITPDFALKLGWAAGRVLGKGLGGKVLIGKDTRISGYMFESALEAGLVAAGMDILLLGPMPTPAIAYLTHTLRGVAGIVISASHNAYEDNGLKFFSSDGDKLPDEVELAIEQEIDEPLRTVGPRTLAR